MLFMAALAAVGGCNGDAVRAPQAAERRCAAGENVHLCGKNLVFAHRGGTVAWPEETIVAFDNAALAGVDVLELDVHATQDGTVVCMHDEKVDRTTDGTGLVKEKTFAELSMLDAGAKFTTDGGATYPYRGKGLRVPTLEEVLGKHSKVPFSIEIKQYAPSIVDKVISIIDTLGMAERVVIASFDDETIRAVRSKRPKFVTALALGEMAKLGTIRDDEDLANYTPPATIYQANAGTITDERMRIVNKLGLRVHVWTVNDEDTMRRMWKLGVHGIMTDNPALLLKVTKELGLTDKGR